MTAIISKSIKEKESKSGKSSQNSEQKKKRGGKRDKRSRKPITEWDGEGQGDKITKEIFF